MKSRIIILFLLTLSVFEINAKDLSNDAIEGIYTIRYRNFTFDHIVFIDEDSLYVPLSNALDNFKFFYNISNEGTNFTGYCGKPDSSFYFNFRTLKAKFVNREIEIDDNDFIIITPEVYVTPNLLAKLFDFDAVIYNADLTIFVRAMYDLPVYTEYKRRLNELNSSYLSDGYYNLMYGRDRKWISGGIMDYNVGLTNFQGENTYNYNTKVGMEILGGDINISSFGNYFQEKSELFNNSFFSWRYFISENKYLTQVNVGDISNAGIRTNNLPSQSIRGVRISNETTQLPTKFSEYVIQDKTAPGTRVELLINNLFYNSVDADENGNYRFDLPLFYGNTNAQLRFYGNDGSYSEEDITFNIANEFLQPGEVKYTVSAGERELDRQFMADGRVSVGISSWLSTTFGVDNNLNKFNNPNFDLNNFSYFNNTSIRLGKNVTSSFDIYFEKLYKGNLRVFLQNYVNLNGSYTKYEGISIFNPTNIQDRYDLNIGFPNVFGLPINLYANAYRLHMQNFTSTILFTSMMVNLNPIFFNVRYYRNQNDFEEGEFTNQSLTAEISYNWTKKPKFLKVLKSTRFSVFTDFDVERNEIMKYGVSLNQNIDKWANLQARYSRSILQGFNQFSMNLIVNLPSFQSNSSANMLNNQLVTNTSLNGTLGFDPDEFAFHLNNPIFQSSVGFGAAKFRFFLDDNANGIYDKGETKIDNVRFSVENGLLERSKDNNAEIAYNLAPYGRFNVSVESESFDNPLWIPKQTNFSFIADPNGYKSIDVPCYAGGVIEGAIAKMVGSEKEYQSGVKVHIMATDSSYHETIPVFSDGTFYKMGVPPGEYHAWVDEMQLEILGLKPDKDFLVFNIKSTTYGDFASGIDFVLDYASDIVNLDDVTLKKSDQIDVTQDNLVENVSDDDLDLTTGNEVEEIIESIDQTIEDNQLIAINENQKYTLYFSGKNDVRISGNSNNLLNSLVDYLQKNQNYKVALVGHTDQFSTMTEHLEISRNRAEAARNYLISKGISPNRILARGVGSLEPASVNNTEAGRKLNRRVEISIIK